MLQFQCFLSLSSTRIACGHCSLSFWERKCSARDSWIEPRSTRKSMITRQSWILQCWFGVLDKVFTPSPVFIFNKTSASEGWDFFIKSHNYKNKLIVKIVSIACPVEEIQTLPRDGKRGKVFSPYIWNVNDCKWHVQLSVTYATIHWGKSQSLSIFWHWGAHTMKENKKKQQKQLACFSPEACSVGTLKLKTSQEITNTPSHLFSLSKATEQICWCQLHDPSLTLTYCSFLLWHHYWLLNDSLTASVRKKDWHRSVTNSYSRAGRIQGLRNPFGYILWSQPWTAACSLL